MEGRPDTTQFWAKLEYGDDGRRASDITAWHPLLAHSADVAAALEVLLRDTIVGRRLAGLGGLVELGPIRIARLCALATIHDAGKANHGFQDRAFKGGARRKGHQKPIIQVGDDGGLSDRIWVPLEIGSMMRWFRERIDLKSFLHTTWSHHGRPVKAKGGISYAIWDDNNRRSPAEEIARLGKAALHWFPDAFQSGDLLPGATGPFEHAFNGALTLADWIGSSFPFWNPDEDGDPNDLDALITRARRLAEDRLQKRALIAAPFQSAIADRVPFGGVLDDPGWTPRPVQSVTADRPIFEEGALTILESDTGSGKTEAALERFFHLYEKGAVDGLYFALPTRTAARQIYNRVERVVKRVFEVHDADPPPVIQAVPGYIEADGVKGVPIDRFDVQWHDDMEEDVARERRWAAEQPKQYLAGSVVIGTVDQALLSALQTRYAHARGTALLRHFLVVDEVHASDMYMTQILNAVLDHHLSAGGHALLMSATLGTAARIAFSEQKTGRQHVPDVEEAMRAGYPLVTHVSAERHTPDPQATDPSGYRKAVEMQVAPVAGDPDAIAQRAIEAARDGARVLIIRNRVEDCIDVQKAVEAHLAPDERDLLLQVHGTPAPHHSRFAKADRSALDDAIETAFGKDEPIRGVIAVATQTVQMSLDLSASLMITDLCPVDVLLQRIGRLHRHGRDEHPAGYDVPRCVVLTPESREMAEWIWEGRGDLQDMAIKGPHGLGTVYQDLRVIEATWRLVEPGDGDEMVTWTIPDDNRKLVERGTNPHVLDRIMDENMGREDATAWQKHADYLFGQNSAAKLSAKNVCLPYDRPFMNVTFPDDDINAAKTRLGLDDVTVELPEAVPSPFQPDGPAVVRRFSIPRYWLRDRDDDTPLPDDFDVTVEQDCDRTGGNIILTLLGKSFLYSRLGFRKRG
ncbi:CRISPR-associated helicase/endonuclease Cas3 [Longibacter salinarum]|uniref:CRISPR-associated helicase/endonuclease Cas3 n=2 Tax=Longibacter salinarum TaxID=1850348 RepID=A0A2A8CUC9_9BACT|nr:CRISPR-associated helicase/endonuclease Cas3 [Longibacter salinarum]